MPGEEVIKLAVLSFFFPSGANQEISIPYQGEDRKVAGRASFQGGAMSCVDYVEEGVLASLYAWRKLVYDAKTGKIGRAAQYKKTAAVRLTDGSGGAARTIKLEGVWPKDLTGSQFQYSNNGYQTVSTTLVFDRGYPE